MEIKDKLLISLRAGASQSRCGIYLYHLDNIDRQNIYQELESERLMGKYHVMRDLHENQSKAWDQIALNAMMKYIGDMYNRKLYSEIATRVGINRLLRERASLESLEALLVATAGLLSTLPVDSFTTEFAQRGRYLLHKHQIKPLNRGQWRSPSLTLSKAPIMRLSQMARVIYDNEMLFNRVINCRTRDDIFDLLNVAASESLSRYFGSATRHIGVDVCDIVGINAIVPILYAYGIYVDDDELIHAANHLNETIPAERNGIINRWRKTGLNPTLAYESQALIELHNSYCKRLLCKECPIYRHARSSESILARIPAFYSE